MVNVSKTGNRRTKAAPRLRTWAQFFHLPVIQIDCCKIVCDN